MEPFHDPAEDLLGTTLGSYEILEILGRGGMGVVYKAMQTNLKRIVALKAVRGDVARKRMHVERFKREVQACTELRHPNIITIFDYGEEREYYFYAMEYLESRTLEDQVDESGGQLPLREVLELGEAVAEAMAYFHSKNLIHRDIKPSNIMVSSDGKVTLMDFGLVKPTQDTALTQEGKAIGTPRYMSPEMLQGHEVDGRSDIFQLGLILYELATGRSAFRGHDVFSLAHNILSTEPDPPSKHNECLGQSFDHLVLNCLAKKREDRYPSAERLIADIKRLRRKVPVHALNERTPTRDDLFSPVSGPIVHTKPMRASGVIEGLRGVDRRILAAALASVVLLVTTLIYVLAARPPTATFLSNDVLVHRRGESAEITWTSKRAYPSIVLLQDATDRHSPPTEITDSLPRATTRHKLALQGLRPETSYSFRIVYPDGSRSVPHGISVGREQELSIQRYQVRRPGWKEVEIVWRSSLPAAAWITYLRAGKEQRVRVSEKPGDRHRVLLRELGVEESLEDLAVHLEAGEQKIRIPRESIPSCRAEARELCREAAAIELGELQAHLAAHIRGQASEQATRERALALLQEHPAGRRLAEWFASRRTWLQGFFAADDVDARKDKLPLYRELNRLADVDRYFDFQKLPPPLEIRKVLNAFIGLAWQQPEGRMTLLAKYGESDLVLTPATETGGKDPLFALYDSVKPTQAKTETLLRPDFSAAHEGAPRRIAVGALVRNLSPDMSLTVRIGDDVELDLHNTRASYPGSYWLGLEDDQEQSRKIRATSNWVVAWCPAELVPNGLENLHVSTRLVPPCKAVHVAIVYGLALFSE